MMQLTPYLRKRLAESPLRLNVCAMTAAFVAYFCMYAFRKPFAAGQYEELSFFATKIDLKTALVISQIFGYALAKYVGMKVCPEVTRQRRASMLVVLIVSAELALLAFAIVPQNFKFLTLFWNGLSLGMVWGLVVWYLEGRQTSEILMAVLSCSFIVSSGIVKDVGRALMNGIAPLGVDSALQIGPVSEFWMPFLTGLIFFPPFLVAVWALNLVPEPSAEDQRMRSVRKTMTTSERVAFVRRFLPGLACLVFAYVMLTSFREFRDSYMVEVLSDLGFDDRAGTITSMETTIACIVLPAMGLIYFLKDNRVAMFGIFGLVAVGTVLVGIATLLYRQAAIDGYWWMLLAGLGSYLAYVPYNSVLFDRLMASTRSVGTAVFAIYIADAMGYTGSVAVQLFKDVVVGGMSHQEFLETLCLWTSVIGTLAVVGGAVYFLKEPKFDTSPQAHELSSLAPTAMEAGTPSSSE